MKFEKTGFTLIELIIVIAIIALLAAATFVAVNPAKRIGDANNAQGWADVTALADAWATYIADNTGTEVTTTPSISAGVTYSIATTTGGTANLAICQNSTGNETTTAAYVDLEGLVSGGYIGAVPTDPSYGGSDGHNTGYYMMKASSGAILFGSCETYDTANIEVIR